MGECVLFKYAYIMYKHILSVDTTAFLCIQYDFASRKHLGEKGRLEM